MNLMMSPKESKPEIEQQIVENLRRVYNQKLDEAVPERFLDLLRQLKTQDSTKDAKNG